METILLWQLDGTRRMRITLFFRQLGKIGCASIILLGVEKFHVYQVRICTKKALLCCADLKCIAEIFICTKWNEKVQIMLNVKFSDLTHNQLSVLIMA